MALDPAALPEDALTMLRERHLASLTTLRADGSPHVVPVGFTYEPAQALVRVITSRDSIKARNAARGGRAVVCQVQGARWLSLEGVASVHAGPAAVAEAVRRYARRYREPRPNPRRVAIHITVDRVLGSA